MENTKSAIIRQKQINLNPPVTVYYGIGILRCFKDELKKYEFDKLYIVTDKNVFDIHGIELYESLKLDDIPVCVHVLETAEKEKSMSGLEKLCASLLNEGITKDSIILSFGGGITGNMTGLAAALIFRGIRYIEAATTFMGMTDSTLSNKQAVNGANGKNQLGLFYPPLFIWSDMAYAATEKNRFIKAAITEGIKNCLISDIDNLSFFRKEGFDPDKADSFFLLEMFELITDSKNAILLNDPTEKEYAVILEYGHTFGHAIEYLTDGRVIHGEAVAAGMCMAAELSYYMGILSEPVRNLHYELLENYISKNILSYDIYSLITPGLILEQIKYDNKRTGNGVGFVLLEDIGKVYNASGNYQTFAENDAVLESIRSFYQTIKCLREESW